VQEQQRDSSAGDGGSRQPDALGFLVSDGLKSTRGQIGALQSPGPQCIRHTTEEPQRSNTLATWKALNPKEEVVACQVLGLVAFLKSLKIIGLGKKQHTETEEQGCRWGLLRDPIRDFIVTAGTGIKVLIGGIQKGGC